MRPQELKLLVIFDVIMTENSITQAAQQLSMSQSAVSKSVSMMRVLWKDKLFVPDGRNIQPTAFAQNLWARIRDPLFNLNMAVEPDSFDPTCAKRTFRIALPDIVLDGLWLDLRLLFEQEAPGLNLHAVPYTITNTKKLLDDADVDLVIGTSNKALENISSDHLFDTSYVCVMRKNHPLGKTKLTVEKFAAAEHLLISMSGGSVSPTDQALTEMGLARRVAFTVNQFSSAVPMIIGSDLIAVLPTELMYRYLASDSLLITQPPIDVPKNSISMLWHNRQNADAGLIWLRKHIKKNLLLRRKQQINEVQKIFNTK